MEVSEQAYKEFEKVWRKHNPGKQVDPELLRRAAGRLLEAVNLIYGDESNENPEKASK